MPHGHDVGLGVCHDGDVHDLDTVIAEHRLQRVVDMGHAHLVRHLLGPAAVEVVETDDLQAGVAIGRQVSHLDDRPGAHDGDPPLVMFGDRDVDGVRDRLPEVETTHAGLPRL